MLSLPANRPSPAAALVRWLQRSGSAALFAVVLAGLAHEAPAMSACDVIKSANDFHEAALGEIDRASLIPGFLAEIFVRPAICDNQLRSLAADFRDPSSPAGCDNDGISCDPVPASDLALYFVFTPPAGDSHMVVVQETCPASIPTGCNDATIPPTRIHCLERVDGATERWRIEENSLPGEGIERRLRFTFPDTTGLADPDYALAGPVTVAVGRADRPLPCFLASSECKDVPDRTLVACADWLFNRDSACTPVEERVNPTAVNVTALPVPTKMVDVCAAEKDPSGLCQATSGGPPPLITVTQDRKGNIRAAVDAGDTLVRIDGESFPRTNRGAFGLKGLNTPLDIKNAEHYKVFASNGARILPLFEPSLDPSNPGEWFGSADAAYMVGFGFAHSCSNDEEVPCSTDIQCEALPCPGGGATCAKTCSVENYPLLCDPASPTFPTVCTVGGAGPILGECPLDASGVPRCRLGPPVSLDILASAGVDDQVVPAPVNECVGQTHPLQTARNDDPDRQDDIMTLLDRFFGFEQRPIGRNDAEGLALTRVVDREPFSFSTHDFEENVVAFLSSEYQECDPSSPSGCDRDGDGLVFDNILEILALDPTGSGPVRDLLASPIRRVGTSVVAPDVDGLDVGVPLAARPELNVGLTPVAVSEGLVFFRTSPDASAHSLTLEAAGEEGSLSPDGGLVAFTTGLALSSRDKNRLPDVYLRDRSTGAVVLASAQIRDSCDDNEKAGSGPSGEAAVSANGLVVYASDSDKQIDRPKGKPQDTNGLRDVFVFDPDTCNVERASQRSDGGQANGPSFAPSISGDGRLVVFTSLATNLDAQDPNPDPDVYLHDRQTGETRLVSVGAAALGTISVDGGSIAFESDGPAGGDDDSAVLVDDGGSDFLVASVASDGAPADRGSFNPFISASGRFVVYESLATTLADADTNGQRDVFVHDLETGRTRRAGVSRAPHECRQPGIPEPVADPDGPSFGPRISEDGRYLFYSSLATGLVPDDGDPTEDVFVEDLETGAIARLSQGLASRAPSASSDGSVVAFEAGPPGASNIVASEGGLDSSSDAVLGVVDTRTDPATLTVLDARAEYVKVANGAAVFVAPGENVKLFRYACGGTVGGGLCDESCSLGCGPVVEDLLRPGVSTAEAISISDRFACALVDEPGGPRPACHEIGTPPSASLEDVAPAGVVADEIQVSGDAAVFTEPRPDGSRMLYEVDLSQASPSAVAVQPVEDMVLGNHVACFRTDEKYTGDQNSDGRTDTAIMWVDDPTDAAAPVSCRFSADICELTPCDPRIPYKSTDRTCKFITNEEVRALPDCLAANRDLNLDGECTELLRSCTLGLDTSAVELSAIRTVDLTLQNTNPLTAVGGQGDLTQAPACILPDRPGDPLSYCPCTAPEVCSDTLGILFTLNCADPDLDGLCDQDEICETVFNPDRSDVDFDMDGIPDACDAFVCGNGELEPLEVCDFSVDPVGCTEACLPEPPQGDASENSVNPDQQGVFPWDLLATPIINLDVVEQNGQPPRMVDVNSLRMAAIVDGVCPGKVCAAGENAGVGCDEDADCPGSFCGGNGNVCVEAGGLTGSACFADSDCGGGNGTCGGAPVAHDLTSDADYAGHLADKNGDGFQDLGLHFRVPGSGIISATTEACLKGRYTVDVGPTPSTRYFVTKDAVNVK